MHVYGGDEVRVRLEGLVVALAAQLPHAQRLVVAHAQQVLAARMEDDAAYPVVVADQIEQALECGHVPYLDAFVARARAQVRSAVCPLIRLQLLLLCLFIDGVGRRRGRRFLKTIGANAICDYC